MYFVTTIDILGVPFSTYKEDEVLQACFRFLQDKTPHFIVTAGPEFVMKVHKNHDLQQVLKKADMITPDGIGIVIASRWYTSHVLTERVTGVDLAEKLLEHASVSGYRVYILGAAEDSLQNALREIRNRFPSLYITGRNGYFKKEAITDVISAVRAESPDLLLVALGQPAQEKFIASHLLELGVPLSIGVGGAIDVLGGTVKRAPGLFQKAKLEWLYRLLREPSRIRRQMALPRFAISAWLDAKRLTRSRSDH